MILIHQIRMYAIHRLSTDFILSPLEKIHLARAHKVATWMDEGVLSLVNSNPRPMLDELATLGWETAAQILWIRDHLLPMNTLRFRIDGIKCRNCLSSTSLINSAQNCASCQQVVPADAELTAPSPGIIWETTDHLIQFREMQCNHLNC